ncbi:hercynine metabolism protein [Synechococcus sp. UW140]|uniref:hercynine metabolism protein n=1 Tax=Synechococcus sp. UW140 TaxID=368503 RepID=UPI003138047A
MQSTNNWWQEIEQELERQFDRFLDDHPSQKELLEKEEANQKQKRLQLRLQTINEQADQLRSKLCKLSAEIKQWRQRVERAHKANATDLAAQAQDHLGQLMGKGRDCWQALAELGVEDQKLRQELKQIPNPNNNKPKYKQDIETAWEKFETDQALEDLKRKQR